MPPNFLQGFSPLRSVRPFYPSFCIYFHVSCIKSCILGKISNQWIFEIFDDSSCFSQNWSMDFCYKMLYNCSWWFDLINLVICEKLKILGLEWIWIGVFVQFGLIWRNWLVWLIVLVITNCYLSCIMINLVKLLDFWNWVFQILGFSMWPLWSSQFCDFKAKLNYFSLH